MTLAQSAHQAGWKGRSGRALFSAVLFLAIACSIAACGGSGATWPSTGTGGSSAGGPGSGGGTPPPPGGGGTPPPPGTIPPPSAPGNLTGATNGPFAANLSWQQSTGTAAVTGYRIERCSGASCSGFTVVGTATGTSFTDIGLT